MNDPSFKHLFAHPLVLGSVGIVVVIALGSAAYYIVGTRQPVAQTGNDIATTTQTITAVGTVEPAQNPDLAFESGGRLARLPVKVGDTVAQGQLLASLDVATLEAQRAQAQANVDAQQAKLDSIKSGARPEDIAASQAALDKAAQDLANMYAGIADTSIDSYAKGNDAVHTQLDQFFSNGDQNPKLSYVTSNSQAEIDAEGKRLSVGLALDTWQRQIGNIDQSNSGLETLLADELSYLSSIRQLLNNLSTTLDNAPGLSATTLAAYRLDISTGLTEVNTAVKNLDTISQNIASQKLAVVQAQAQLDLKRVGALPSDIAAQQAAVAAAQASVANVDAQIQNATIVAPFSGTVASVHAKLGDVVAANTPIVSLNPLSALQISAYVSEADATKIKAGEKADVTLDAYGSGQHFAAVVGSIDRSPTMQAGVPAYKVTLQFGHENKAVSSGMTANITIAQ